MRRLLPTQRGVLDNVWSAIIIWAVGPVIGAALGVVLSTLADLTPFVTAIVLLLGIAVGVIVAAIGIAAVVGVYSRMAQDRTAPAGRVTTRSQYRDGAIEPKSVGSGSDPAFPLHTAERATRLAGALRELRTARANVSIDFMAPSHFPLAQRLSSAFKLAGWEASFNQTPQEPFRHQYVENIEVRGFNAILVHGVAEALRACNVQQVVTNVEEGKIALDNPKYAWAEARIRIMVGHTRQQEVKEIVLPPIGSALGPGNFTPTHEFSLDGGSVALKIRSPYLGAASDEVVIDGCSVVDPRGKIYESAGWASATGSVQLTRAYYYPAQFGAPPLEVGRYTARWRIKIEIDDYKTTIEETDSFQVGLSILKRRG